MDSRINPAAPHMEKKMDSTERTFCHVDLNIISVLTFH